ncbi:hypothetical protein L2E82_22849 [Cichorium intybus]|uniref:Uncharacterized protein n=1 Tax=Cichorium intybus TaxID=13427 RepID=A0ACB9DZK6_CICIN|nr:hypothetical protein L2E82_22849 [Cichorium intybus]
MQDVKDGKVKPSQAGTYSISNNSSFSRSWVLDTGCGFHICSNLQGLEESRELEHGRLNLVMGNRRMSPVTKISVYGLMLSSGDGVLESFNLGSDDVCESCLLGKMTKSPFKGSFERGEGLLDIIHTDVCGPFRTTTKDGTRFYVTFTDDFSRYGYVYLITNKSDTFEKFKEFKNQAENQLGRKIKMLRSDRGGEYLSIEFLDYLKECGIVSQLSPPRTPQLNGVAERRN